MIKNSLVITFFLFLLSGCASEVDKRVDTVLSISGANRTELETVLKHYKQIGRASCRERVSLVV